MTYNSLITHHDSTKSKVIAIDFDNSTVSNDYPHVGKSIGSEEVLKELIVKGHRLILWTMREGKELLDAIDWYSKNNIELYGVQRNPQQMSFIDEPDLILNTPKPRCDYFIDDLAVGCPLIKEENKEPHINWKIMRVLLKEKGLL
jgi:hypothetical protein